ncbi:MAG TPA: hypothetical protein PL160_00660 [Candidatus Cloacimonas sp.]|nr:hypothetical protein [Candidatus Cloacimonas sp.]
MPFSSQRSDCILDAAPELQLKVGGQEVVIVPFVQKLLKDTLMAFVDNLKGVDKDSEIELRIKR